MSVAVVLSEGLISQAEYGEALVAVVGLISRCL